MQKRIALAVFLAMVLAAPILGAKKRTLRTKECPKGSIAYDDGDSFSCAGEPIRVLGIDTPEITHAAHGIHRDQPKGREAAAFTKEQLSKARRVVIVRGGRDPYGRTLAHVLIDGELLGVQLIAAGLAWENVSRYGDNGLPAFALQITEAWKALPKKPAFQDPHNWRRKHQKR